MPLFREIRVKEGHTVAKKLRCVGAGNPPPSVQWRKLNGSLSDRVSIETKMPSTNARNVTRVAVFLVFTEAQRDDAGVYECLISSQLKNITKNVSLIVQCMQQIANL